MMGQDVNPGYRAYDFSGMTTEEKVAALRQLMIAFNRPWRR